MKDDADQQRDKETAWQQGATWLSRTLSVVIIMVLPGIIGSILDRRLGTTYLAMIGFGLGLVAGTAGLIVLAKRLTPPARGKPLPWDEETPADDSEDADAPSRE